jgi:hypothetical protein
MVELFGFLLDLCFRAIDYLLQTRRGRGTQRPRGKPGDGASAVGKRRGVIVVRGPDH